jgi:dTDP-glucose 4,6-dehydratase
MKSKKNKILVMGGSGFVGTNFVNYLSYFSKNIIFNVDKLSRESTDEKFKKIKLKKNYFFYKFDLTDQNKLTKLINKIQPNLIVNFAAESHVDRSIESPKTFFLNNIQIAISLGEASKKIKNEFKIIHISTDEVFGDIAKGTVNENCKLDPTSPYSVSKLCSDMILRSYADIFGYKLTTIQMCNNYGPYQFPEKLIPTAINCLINKRMIPVYGKGTNIREWMYVGDACKAIYKLCLIKNLKQSYNLGSDKRVNNLKIIDILIKSFYQHKIKNKNKKYYFFTTDRPIHDKRYALNSAAAKEEIGRYAVTLLNRGLQKTVEWYLNNTSWLKECGKKYSGKRQGLN